MGNMGEVFIVRKKRRPEKSMSEAQKRINEINFEKFMQGIRQDLPADYTLLSNRLDRRLFHNYLRRG